MGACLCNGWCFHPLLLFCFRQMISAQSALVCALPCSSDADAWSAFSTSFLDLVHVWISQWIDMYLAVNKEKVKRQGWKKKEEYRQIRVETYRILWPMNFNFILIHHSLNQIDYNHLYGSLFIDLLFLDPE